MTLDKQFAHSKVSLLAPPQIHIMIANYTRILRDNHTVEPYVVVLTKNVDPRTVQDRLTLKCKATDGALRMTVTNEPETC